MSDIYLNTSGSSQKYINGQLINTSSMHGVFTDQGGELLFQNGPNEKLIILDKNDMHHLLETPPTSTSLVDRLKKALKKSKKQKKSKSKKSKK